LRPFLLLLICGTVFALSYVASLFVSGTFSTQERDLARRYLGRFASMFRGEPSEEVV